MTSTNSNVTEFITSYETAFTRNIKLGFFIAVTPFAIICDIILIYYLVFDRMIRNILHYHSILALLLVCLALETIEVPRIMHYLRIGIVTLQTDLHCLLWQWLDYILGGLINVYMLWFSLERHLFIFYSSMFNTFKRRLVFHYFPLIIIFVCVSLYYSIAFFIYPCEPQYDFTQPLCGLPCYTFQASISLYDLFAHNWIPLLCTPLLDSALIVRVACRRNIGQQTRWQKHRKMIVQVLVISNLFVIIQTPYVLIAFIQILGNVPDFALYIQVVYFYYCLWLFALVLPFACLSCLPEVKNKIRMDFMRCIERNNGIVPFPLSQTRLRTC
ncbi:unnamed protein product [Adineta ricciae]|uniref:G-protein coupled receptors family 1 profile domain-containing protein n=1 Tax=Adineta ricciae TaxID=249248 RepID=A0A814HTI6_ADIRI|nr:unnamed protein product [Adineta ricciae]CAF1244718.1 unnamed protein product [Adineta ricciae]